MRKTDAMRILGTQVAIAKAAGVTQPTVSGWTEIIPAAPALRLAQAYPQIPLRLEDYTKGKASAA